MSLFKTFRGNKSNLPQTINDGAIYALQDTEELYIDVSADQRIKISDIIEVDKKEDLPLAPLENKFYYAKDAGSLFKYNGTEYLEIPQAPLYIDFTYSSSSDDDGLSLIYTTTFSFDKAIEEGKKGRRIIANFDDGLFFADVYYDEGESLYNNSFPLFSLYDGVFAFGSFYWGRESGNQIEISCFGASSFNDRVGAVMPQVGDYTPEMVGMENGVIYENAKATLPSSVKWYSVTYGNGKFVAIAFDSNNAAYSTDGITWTQTTMPSSAKWYSVTYGNGKFVAITQNANKVAYSTDGITWVETTFSLATSWQSVTYGNGKFVAVAYGSSTAIYSDDGITWTQTTMPSSAKWYSVTYGNGKFVAIAFDSNNAAYSTDGITWTQTTMPSSTYWRSVTYGNGKFVAITTNSFIAAYSTDGITWTRTELPSTNYWDAVVAGNGNFVAVTSSTNEAACSTDGITWTQTTMPSSAKWYSVTYGNGKFVAIAADSDKVAYSIDGITWDDSIQRLIKPDNTDITEEVKSLIAPTAMTEDEIKSLWESV